MSVAGPPAPAIATRRRDVHGTPNAAPTEVARDRLGHGPRARQRRAATRPSGVGAREQPDHRGPGPAHERLLGARLARLRRAPRRSRGHSEIAARCRSLCSSSAIAGQRRAQLERGGQPGAAAARAACRLRPSPSRSASRVDLRRREPLRCGQHEQPERTAGVGQALQPLAGARGKPAPGGDLRGHVGAELRAQLAAAAPDRPAPRRARPGAAWRRRRPSRPPDRPRPGSA